MSATPQPASTAAFVRRVGSATASSTKTTISVPVGAPGVAGASASTTAFSSGTAPVTSQASEAFTGSVGTESGAAPAWGSGWTALPTLAVSSDYLGTAYRMVSATGGYAATGTICGQWMASIVTLKTS